MADSNNIRIENILIKNNSTRTEKEIHLKLLGKLYLKNLKIVNENVNLDQIALNIENTKESKIENI